MAEHHVVEGVRSIRSAINDITGFYGSNDQTMILLAKGVLLGSYHFNARSSPYSRGTIAAKREEAVLVEDSLRGIALRVQCCDSKTLSAEILSRAVLDDWVVNVAGTPAVGHRSIVLKQVLDFVNLKKPDYRDGLIVFGEQLNARLSRDDARPYGAPVNVDLERLDGSSLLQVRTLYREFGKIEEIAHLLAPRRG